MEHLYKVLRENVFILIANEGCGLVDGDFSGWFPMGSMVSLMAVHSHHTVGHGDCGHLENCASNPWLLQALLFFPKLFCRNVPRKPVGAQICIISYILILPQPLKSFVLILQQRIKDMWFIHLDKYL